VGPLKEGGGGGGRTNQSTGGSFVLQKKQTDNQKKSWLKAAGPITTATEMLKGEGQKCEM